MDWDDVRVFAAVARQRSLSVGARAAAVDRSTAGRRIAALERALGARLFLRTRDGLRLSAAGERLLAHADLMADAARALESSAREESRGLSGRVRIATTEMLAALLVRLGLLSLRERHPALELELLGGNRVVDLARGEAELALRVVSVKEPSLRVRRIASLGFGLVASEAYLKRRGRPRTEADCAGHDVVLYGGELATLPEARWLGAKKDVHVVLRTNSMTALLAAASEGAGLAVLSGRFSERQLGLVRLWDIEALPPRRLFLAMHPDAAARPAVRAVADHVARALFFSVRLLNSSPGAPGLPPRRRPCPARAGPGPPATCPKSDSSTRSSALGMPDTSRRLSSTGKYRSVLDGITMARAVMAASARVEVASEGGCSGRCRLPASSRARTEDRLRRWPGDRLPRLAAAPRPRRVRASRGADRKEGLAVGPPRVHPAEGGESAARRRAIAAGVEVRIREERRLHSLEEHEVVRRRARRAADGEERPTRSGKSAA